MERIFSFNSLESFHSSSSAELAELVLQAKPEVREWLRQSFGITLDVSSREMRVVHDGQRIGIGSFWSSNMLVHFKIGPKVAFRVHDLLSSLKNTLGWANYITFGDTKASPADMKGGDFHTSFLVALLEDIALYASRHADITHIRKQELVKWKIKGRPDVHATVRRLGRGVVDGFICDIYDDKAFQVYADILIKTSSAIESDLREMGELIAPIEEDIIHATRIIRTRLGPLASGNFSLSILLRTCRPPFPFGLREILYRCMRYWLWEGQIDLAYKGSYEPYKELVLKLDDIFEIYVGEKWSDALSTDFSFYRSPEWNYRIDDSGGFDQKRHLVPDHLLVSNDRELMLILDAKYRTDVGSPDAIYQILSYLSYQSTAFIGVPIKIGILVYPGEKWQVREVRGFDKSIFCVSMPISCENISIGIREIVYNSIKNVGVEHVKST